MNEQNRRLILGTTLAVGVAASALLRTKRYDLNGKVTLITGGSRGLGLVLCREFAKQGAKVAVCARDEGELIEARDLLANEGHNVTVYRCDVTQREDVRGLMDRVRMDLGPLDILVNNAGTISVGPEETMTLSDYSQAMGTHFWGPLYGMEAIIPEMKKQGGGRIVNIASIGGKLPVPHLAPYTASKFALVGLSEALHAELATHGIKVTTVCPGLMRTGSPENVTFKGQNIKEYRWFTISDSLPGLSISAESAAKQIVGACRRGDAEVVLSLPAKVGAFAYGTFPSLTLRVLRTVARLLPETGGVGAAGASGRESHSGPITSVLTILTRKAARKNNELTVAG